VQYLQLVPMVVPVRSLAFPQLLWNVLRIAITLRAQKTLSHWCPWKTAAFAAKKKAATGHSVLLPSIPTAAIAVLTTAVAGRPVLDFLLFALPPLAPASDTMTVRAARNPATAGSLAMEVLQTAVRVEAVESDMMPAFAAMTTAAAGRLDLEFLPPAVRHAAAASTLAAIADRSVLNSPAAARDPTATSAPPLAVATVLAAEFASSSSPKCRTTPCQLQFVLL